MTQRSLDVESEEIHELMVQVFGAKRVPLALLGRIRDYREFHRTDFPAVKATVKPGVKVDEFDFYFDFVLSLAEQLEPFWNV